jgi:hypothetical protein
MSLYAQHQCGGDTPRGVQLTVAMVGTGGEVEGEPRTHQVTEG